MLLTDSLLRSSAADGACFSVRNEWNNASLDLSFKEAAIALAEHRQQLASTTATTTCLVAYMSWNSIDMVLSIFSCIQCPYTVPALINTRWTANEIAAVLEQAPSRMYKHLLLFVGPDFQTTALTVAGKLKSKFLSVQLKLIPTFGVKRLRPFRKESRKGRTTSGSTSANAPLAEQLSRTTALILFTSGTTSIPKGVLLSHDALFTQAYAKQRLLYSSTTQLLGSTVPFFHVGGLSSLLAVWMAGGTIVLPDQPSRGFDPARLLLHASNTLVVVPTMLYLLQKRYHQEVVTSFPHVQCVLIGGQSASPPLLACTRRLFPHARLVQTYACTEAASSLTFHDVTIRGTDEQNKQIDGGGVVGTPHVQVALFDKNSSTMITQPHVMGTIATRGRHVMNGYWAGPSRNKNDWFYTTDLGAWDDHGRLVFCGRATDTIRTGGETVLAAPVEACLLLHAAIAECAVFGIPDQKLGEVVCCAVVVNNNQQTLSVADVRRLCREHGLAAYKHPRRVLSVSELPKNASGKVLKFRLAEQLVQSKL